LAIDQVKEHELADHIAQLEGNLARQLPAEMLQGFQGAIQTLVNGGITANAVNVGQKAPDFRCRTKSAIPSRSILCCSAVRP